MFSLCFRLYLSYLSVFVYVKRISQNYWPNLHENFMDWLEKIPGPSDYISVTLTLSLKAKTSKSCS